LVEYGLLYKNSVEKWWNASCKSCSGDIMERIESLKGDDALDSDVLAEKQRIQRLVEHRELIQERGAGGDRHATPSSARNLNGAVTTPSAVNGHSIDMDAEEEDMDRVIIANLHKLYGGAKCCGPQTPVHAVRGVHLGVKQGEVFGYLGVNGAGKTTTLACLSGERSATYGDAFVNGHSIENQPAVRRFIGYCPQFDALFPLLTGREHLKFYGRVKGLRGSALEEQVAMLLDVLSLRKYADRRAGTYSGGNKRKLSVAMAMIGNPPIVFLDEPSTGMDPMARRSMWEFIRATMSGRCVVLTTHSMEECEALCHRLCIMTAGQLQCLGTPQHLKSKFGHGFQLDMTLAERDGNGSTDITTLRMTVEDALKASFKRFDINLIEGNERKLVYEMVLKEESAAADSDIAGNAGDGGLSLSKVFRTMEDHKKELPIESYALSQTTLEQIFIKMAKRGSEQVSE